MTAPAGGSAATQGITVTRVGQALGMIPTLRAGSRTTGGPLVYHGGQVMGHAGFRFFAWNLGVDQANASLYTSKIFTFTQSVSDFPQQPNIALWAASQYTDASGQNALADSEFAGGEMVPITTPFPKNGCRDRYTKICITNAQVVKMIADYLAFTIPGTLDPPPTWIMNMVLLPRNVAVCGPTTAGCSFVNNCGYHSWFDTTNSFFSSEVFFAVLPYSSFVPSKCDGLPHPNGSPADPTLDHASHEAAEMVTDPDGHGWFDTSGNEMGDKCYQTFAPALGRTKFGKYNQVIGSDRGYTPSQDDYWLQDEWSNHSNRCVARGT